MYVLKSFHPIIKYDYYVQDEWNEVQTWSQPQLLTNQDYDHINMVVMRFTYMCKRGGKHENYDANGMWHGMKTYLLLSSIQCTQGQSHSQGMTSIGYEINRKLYQLKPIEFENTTPKIANRKC